MWRYLTGSFLMASIEVRYSPHYYELLLLLSTTDHTITAGVRRIDAAYFD